MQWFGSALELNIYIVAASDAEADPERRLRWGDHWFKQSLGRAIEALGHTVTENALQAEVVVNCHGAAVQKLPEWTYNILWIVGHPAQVAAQTCQEYDAVFAESAEFAAHIGAVHLPGASDMVPMDVPITHGAVFVGNYRPGRVLEPDGESLEVWGEGWQGLPAGVWQGPYYPHDKLNELYASSRYALNDTHADMMKWGMRNPRYYDTLAALGGKVPTFRECAEVLMRRVPRVRHMLDLGCGTKPRPGMLGVDLQGADCWTWESAMRHDLEQGLPPIASGFTDGPPVSVIVADNILEHLTNLIPLLNDCHKVLKPTGRMHIRVPNADNGATTAWADPTHKRAFVQATFDYFDVAHQRWREYGQSYGIHPWRIVYNRVHDRFIDVMMRPADG